MNDRPAVQVNVYATLRQYVGGRPTLNTQIEPGDNVQSVLAQLGIPAEKTRIIFVDHCAADLKSPLSGGEVIGVFPAVGGG